MELVYYETFDTKEEAMRREHAVKRLSRKQKMMLIENFGSNNFRQKKGQS